MLKKLKEYWNQEDKLKHFIVTAAITELMFTITLFILPLWGIISVSIIVPAFIAAYYEVYQYRHPEKGVCNPNDFYAGLIGIFVVLIQWLIFFGIYKFFPIFVI